MGYNLYIGNAQLADLECEDGQYLARIDVITTARDDAPRDGSLGDGESVRFPSYTGWSEFCDLAGLRPMFYDEDRGLLRMHPGTFALDASHLAEVRAATIRCQDYTGEEKDMVSGRLAWLEYWIDWALKHCERPALKNS